MYYLLVCMLQFFDVLAANCCNTIMYGVYLGNCICYMLITAIKNLPADLRFTVLH